MHVFGRRRHLRPESRFFPKTNFERVVAGIPERAEVVFMFGEIDCREGIVGAVEKTRCFPVLASGVSNLTLLMRYTDVDVALKVAVGWVMGFRGLR